MHGSGNEKCQQRGLRNPRPTCGYPREVRHLENSSKLLLLRVAEPQYQQRLNEYWNHAKSATRRANGFFLQDRERQEIHGQQEGACGKDNMTYGAWVISG
jgi:hypothetical protein